MKTTDQELVSILETAKQDPVVNRFPSTNYKLIRMIERAKLGEYHDRKSHSQTPKKDLSLELRTVGLYQVADAVDAGEFDEGKDS